MTEERYQEIKDSYIKNIKRFMADMGGIFPHISVFGSHKNGDDKDAIIHIPIPDEFLRSEDLKDQFVEDILPEIASKVRERFVPYGVAWSSEAWVRSASKDEPFPENWKELPIEREVLFVNMEFENRNEAVVYEIKRMGKQVNSDGELVDHVDLIEEDFKGAEGMGGRFTGLLQKFTAHS